MNSDNDLTSENNLLYDYLKEKNLKPHFGSLYITRTSKNIAFCPHIFSIYIPSGQSPCCANRENRISYFTKFNIIFFILSRGTKSMGQISSRTNFWPCCHLRGFIKRFRRVMGWSRVYFCKCVGLE